MNPFLHNAEKNQTYFKVIALWTSHKYVSPIFNTMHERVDTSTTFIMMKRLIKKVIFLGAGQKLWTYIWVSKDVRQVNHNAKSNYLEYR